MLIRKTILIIMVFMIILSLPVLARGRREAKNAVAVVNGERISESQLETLMNGMSQQYDTQRAELSTDQQRQLRDQAIDELITDEVLYQEAEKKEISVTKEQLKQQMETLKGRYPDEETYKSTIESAGFSEKSFKEYIRRNLIIQKLLQQEVESKIQIKEADLKQFYEENKAYFEMPEQIEARHILISTEGMETKDEKRQAFREAQTIKVKLDNGADFAQTAREESDGPSSSKGGSLGTFGRGSMVPAFEETAFTLEPGEISDVVETRFGYHIIQVTNTIEAGTVPFDQAKANIEQFLIQQKHQEIYNDYITQLREAADIQKTEIESDSSQD